MELEPITVALTVRRCDCAPQAPQPFFVTSIHTIIIFIFFRSASQPDFLAAMQGEDSGIGQEVLLQEPASIFDRPGFGSVAFRYVYYCLYVFRHTLLASKIFIATISRTQQGRQREPCVTLRYPLSAEFQSIAC